MTATPQWCRAIQRQTAPNPGPRSRREEWPVEHVHGQMQWSATPVHLAAVPDFELSPEGIEARELVTAAARRKRVARWVLGVAVAVLAVVLAYT